MDTPSDIARLIDAALGASYRLACVGPYNDKVRAERDAARAALERAYVSSTELRSALARVKLECLTGAYARAALSRIVRICIDAGITEQLDDLRKDATDG